MTIQMLQEKTSTEKPQVILVVTSAEDLTTDYLIRRIEERGLPFFRFNTEEVVSRFDVSIRLTATGNEFSITDLTRGIELKSESILGAYFRRPGTPILAEGDKAETGFNTRELEETLRSIWRMIPSGSWLNDPESIWLANNKVKQLMVAKDTGFRIPNTLISSQRTDVLEFINTHADTVIAKAVKNGFLLQSIQQI